MAAGEKERAQTHDLQSRMEVRPCELSIQAINFCLSSLYVWLQVGCNVVTTYSKILTVQSASFKRHIHVTLKMYKQYIMSHTMCHMLMSLLTITVLLQYITSRVGEPTLLKMGCDGHTNYRSH